MSISDKEEQIFKRWSQVREKFVSDGMVDEESYNNSKIKLMFILKEVNDEEGGNWDLRKFIRDGARWQTWNNITRWVKGIQELDRDYSWKEIEDVTVKNGQQYLNCIIAVNLKKSPGKAVTDNNELHKIALEDKAFLKEQFYLYDPDLIICCGTTTSNALHKIIDFGEKVDWKQTRRGVWYHEFKQGRNLIEYSHPEARVANNLLYYGLIDTIKELLF